jgi:hypothetical protein
MDNSPFINKVRRIFDWLKSTSAAIGRRVDRAGAGYNPGQAGPADTSHLGHSHGGHGYGGHGHGGGGFGGGGHGH